MTHAIRKQTKADFAARVQRVAPGYGRSRTAPPPQSGSPFALGLLGFAWIYLAVSVAQNRGHLHASIEASALPPHAQVWVMAGLAAMLAVSAVMVIVHLARLLRRGHRGTSGSILAGGLFAMAFCHIPTGIFEAGIAMLDFNTSRLLRSAGATMQDGVGFDLVSISFTAAR
ncbi:hypothetical protein [Roseivivax sediminis]|uniref:Uncharacterized protein n=1 Tax=Roseivivax sediminis TaxID=936889 RepID=A0A1I1WYH2_9RHOB|nr:hypothetical protein [Roseivivax sediminis]SFE00244.1 hypothetical protein SAMN04515678_105161 [Roseivivax sediminis]